MLYWEAMLGVLGGCRRCSGGGDDAGGAVLGRPCCRGPCWETILPTVWCGGPGPPDVSEVGCAGWGSPCAGGQVLFSIAELGPAGPGDLRGGQGGSATSRDL